MGSDMFAVGMPVGNYSVNSHRANVVDERCSESRMERSKGQLKAKNKTQLAAGMTMLIKAHVQCTTEPQHAPR
jgi:hypothetical protein